MTSTRSILLLTLILGILGGSIIYETITVVESIKAKALEVNSTYKSKN